MYVKVDGQLTAINRIELTSDSKTILLHILTETGKKEVYKCPCEPPNYYHLRRLLSSDLYKPSDVVCENKDFLMWMTLTLLNIDNQHQIIVSNIFNNITK